MLVISGFLILMLLLLFVTVIIAFIVEPRLEAKPDKQFRHALLLLQRVRSDTYFVALSDPELREAITRFIDQQHKSLNE